VDIAETLLRRRAPLTPPRRFTPIGRGDFATIGAELTGYLVELGDLKPDSRVLDVGCGMGRVAIPLMDVLTQGRYDGLDPMAEAVEWCTRNVTARRPSFRFRVAEVQSPPYRRRGQHAADYRFPYEDESFDVVALFSVFTHMRPAGTRNYLREIARVLRPGGRCIATYFLANDESEALIAAGRARTDPRHRLRDDRDGTAYLAVDRRTPEFGIVQSEVEARGMYDDAGLRLLEPIRYGFWPGRREFLSFQDLVVADRPA
jgi:SAM-dependent methyltransferase